MDNLQGFETWFFGSLISLLIIVLGFFLKSWAANMETIVKEHGKEIAELKATQLVHEHRLEVSYEARADGKKAFEAIMTKLGAMGSRS